MLRLKHSVQPVQYIERIVRAGGCLVVVAQWSEHWQLKPGALGLIPGGYWIFTFRSSPPPQNNKPVFIFRLRQDVLKQAYLPVYLTYDQR